MAGLGVSGCKSGIYVGILGGEILRGISPGDIPITGPEVADTALNLERAAMLEIELPVEELATSMLYSRLLVAVGTNVGLVIIAQCNVPSRERSYQIY
jgi:ABC-type uncharacterized transport system substrate-binding protein